MVSVGVAICAASLCWTDSQQELLSISVSLAAGGVVPAPAQMATRQQPRVLLPCRPLCRWREHGNVARGWQTLDGRQGPDALDEHITGAGSEIVDGLVIAEGQVSPWEYSQFDHLSMESTAMGSS